jgi:hypothetical protein
MIDFCKALVKYKSFCGRPKCTDYISNSGLSEIKRILLSGAPYLGDEVHLHLGKEVHLRSLLFRRTKRKFSKKIETDIKGMCESLAKNSFWKILMQVCEKEKEHIRKIHGVNVKVILDLKGLKAYKRLGADLKTTSCKTKEQFIKTAIEKYDYLRQGWLYKQAEDLDDFYFIGVQKHYPYKVFILDTADYEKEEQAIAKETLWLIELYKLVGRAFVKGAPNRKRTQPGTREKTWPLLKRNGEDSNNRKPIVQQRNNSRRLLQNSYSTKMQSAVKLRRIG